MKKQKTNEIVINMESRSGNERFARMCAAAYVSALDPTVEELTDIKTVISEAVTNAVVHAYGDSLGTIRLKFEMVGVHTVRVTVKDYGVGISDVEQAMQPCFTTGSEDRSGMGFTIKQSYSDRLRVRSRPGKGTSVVFEKRIKVKNER